jgi:hypothetical protein
MEDWLVYSDGCCHNPHSDLECHMHVARSIKNSAVCVLFVTYWHPNSGNQLIFTNITRQSK